MHAFKIIFPLLFSLVEWEKISIEFILENKVWAVTFNESFFACIVIIITRIFFRVRKELKRFFGINLEGLKMFKKVYFVTFHWHFIFVQCLKVCVIAKHTSFESQERRQSWYQIESFRMSGMLFKMNSVKEWNIFLQLHSWSG